MFARALDLFRGKAITIPPMDGALRPNTILDDAPSLLDIARPDNLTWIEDRLVFMPAAPRAIDQNRDRTQPACHRDNSLAGLGRIERKRQSLCAGFPRQRL